MTQDEVDPEITYFREIERGFVERRGDPLFISNADWVFLSKLRKKNVPMRVVLRGIGDAFDAHAHSFARKQKIRTLKFCEPEITTAVTRHRRALNSDGLSKKSTTAALERLREKLGETPSDRRLSPVKHRAATRLSEISHSYAKDPEFDLDAALADAEDRFADDLIAIAGREEIAALESETRRATAAFESRMPPRVYETLVLESTRRKILQKYLLPRFHLAELE